MTTRIQQGAAAVIAAFRAHQPRLNARGPETVAERYAAADAALAALLEAAGKMPPQAEGAFRALAELLIFERQGEGEANLDVWRPEAAMTHREKEFQRAALYAFEAAGWQHADPPGNVLPFPSR